MSFFFDVFGPFDVGREDGIVSRKCQSGLWADVKVYDQDLDKSIGCYMFCISFGDKITPWYIGKTIAKGGFRAESFTGHKVAVYNRCLNERKGIPKLFLFPMTTQEGGENSRFSKDRTGGAKVIDWLEKTLMTMALQKNEDLWNIRDLTLSRSVTVRGIIGAKSRGRPFAEVQEARRALLS